MIWLRRWNFIERARFERQLWEAFERGEPLEKRLQELGAELDQARSGGASAADLEALQLRLEIWTSTLPRIRRLEARMAKLPPR